MPSKSNKKEEKTSPVKGTITISKEAKKILEEKEKEKQAKVVKSTSKNNVDKEKDASVKADAFRVYIIIFILCSIVCLLLEIFSFRISLKNQESIEEIKNDKNRKTKIVTYIEDYFSDEELEDALKNKDVILKN